MRRFGYRPDAHDPHDVKFGANARAGGGGFGPAPKRASLRDHCEGLIFQRDGEGCVGWSIAQAIHVCHLRDGVKAERPSPLYVWNNSRIAERELHLNTGTYIRTALKQCNKLGYCKERYFPSDNPGRDFNLEPDQLVIQQAIDQTSPIAYERLDGYGVARSEQVRLTIGVKRSPFVFGTLVSRAFTELGEHEPQKVPDVDETLIGGHAMCGLEYDEFGVYGPGTWEDWGNAGWFALSWAYIEWIQTRDLWGINAPPKFRT